MQSSHINIYDFDHTIYDGDSTLHFYLYCLRQKPLLAIYVCKPAFMALLFIFRLVSRESFKQSFYQSFLPRIDAEALLEGFWKVHSRNIKPFYLQQQSSSDIIVTASPHFIIKPIAQQLGFRLIASEVNARTGELESVNCRGEHKVDLLHASGLISSGETIKNFYTDSSSDTPLANLAQHAFFVKKHTITPFNSARKRSNPFVSLKFVRFLFVGGINVISGIGFASIASLVLQPNIAFVCGYLMSLLVGYLLMARIVFDASETSIVQFVKYCIGYLPNFIVQVVTIAIVHNHFGLAPILAYCIAAAIAIPVTFIILKMKVFQRNSKTQADTRTAPSSQS